MAHIIQLFVESRYKVNRKLIKNTISTLLKDQGVLKNVEISVAIVGDRKMRELSRKYKGEDKTRNVLSFSLVEGKSAAMPDDDVLRLGDIVISYPVVIDEAAKQEKLVDERVDELVQHGLMHLLGIHHE